MKEKSSLCVARLFVVIHPTKSMSDSNLARSDSLEEGGSEMSSRDGETPSYNSWRYGDEASLYSIAEDSREDWQSSRNSLSESQQAPQSTPAPLLDVEEPEEAPIEVRWLTAEDMENEGAKDEENNGIIAVASRDSDEQLLDEVDLDEEEVALGPRHNARRSALFLLFIMCAAVVIILSMTLALRNRDDRLPNRVSGGIATPEDEFVNRGVDPGPSVDPTQGAKSGPATVDAYQVVRDAVTSCPQTNPNDLSNPSMQQSEFFENLVYEVEGLITTTSDGDQVLDEKVGTGWILEKWALFSLFFSTEGEYWKSYNNWLSSEDVCNWYNQAADDTNSHCAIREVGGAALMKLKLCK